MANRLKPGEIRVLVVDYGPNRNLGLRYRDPVTGRTVFKTSGTRRRGEALKEAGKWQDELQSGRYKPASRTTWAELRVRYETEAMMAMKPETIAGMCGKFDALERILNPGLLSSITIDRLEELQRTLARETVAREVDGKTVEETILRTPATVRGHMTVIMGCLRWAHKRGMLNKVPEVETMKADDDPMKGRAITPQEFCVMASKIETVRPAGELEQWRRLLWGLWWSGLRLSEAIGMTWDDPQRIHVKLDGEKSTITIPGCQKNGKHTVGPIVPEFYEFLVATPEAERTGLVFPLPFRRKDTISKVICEIGEASGVLVNETSGKFASAHDLRRSFGVRWAMRVMPAVLKTLMRHSSIDTTMKYYVGQATEEMGKATWAAFRAAAPKALPDEIGPEAKEVTLPVNSENASS